MQVVLTLFLLPFHLQDFFRPTTGRSYGITTLRKVRLALTMARNTTRIPSASNFIVHVLMATKIMNVPREVDGCIVECGAFKGGSTANLSLVAALCGRELHVFDSFQGLPPPSEEDRSHVLLSRGEVHTYQAGAFAGSLDEVRANVTRFGDVGVCTFHVGYFETSLPEFEVPVVFVTVDVDLVESERECLRRLWPLLGSNCVLFTDEADHLEIAALFYDRDWWHEELGEPPPGLVGAGNGLGLFPASGGCRSTVGYTVKQPDAADLVLKPQDAFGR